MLCEDPVFQPSMEEDASSENLNDNSDGEDLRLMDDEEATPRFNQTVLKASLTMKFGSSAKPGSRPFDKL